MGAFDPTRCEPLVVAFAAMAAVPLGVLAVLAAGDFLCACVGRAFFRDK